ncbi:hypothetical protein AFCA_000353 [Aspergillus flavus]|nr:hypothetical protein AFCA_000353 [Aspergillus flavus]
MLVQPCSTAANMIGFGWGDRYQDFALPYGTTISRSPCRKALPSSFVPFEPETHPQERPGAISPLYRQQTNWHQ